MLLRDGGIDAAFSTDCSTSVHVRAFSCFFVLVGVFTCTTSTNTNNNTNINININTSTNTNTNIFITRAREMRLDKKMQLTIRSGFDIRNAFMNVNFMLIFAHAIDKSEQMCYNNDTELHNATLIDQTVCVML